MRAACGWAVELPPARPAEPGAGGTAAPPARATRLLTLEQAINLALAGNRALRDAGGAIAATGYSLVSAGSDFELKVFPGVRAGVSGAQGDTTSRVGLGLDLQKKFGFGTTVDVLPETRFEYDSYRTSVGAKLQQPLLRGRGEEVAFAALRGAEHSVRAARRGFHLREIDTVLQTVGAVYHVVQQRELLRVTEESAERLRGHAETARARERAGLADPIDAYRAGIQLTQAEDSLATVREGLQNALDALKIILALPLAETIEVDAPIAYQPPDLTEEEAAVTAGANRIELGQSEDAVREAERLMRLARNRLLLDLNLVLSYSRYGQGETFSKGAAFDLDSWGATFESTTALGRTAERAAYEQQLLAVQSAVRGREQQRDEIVRQVRSEHRALRRTLQRIGIQTERMRQADGQLELAKLKQRHGMASNFDVIDAESFLRQAQGDHLGAVTDYIVGTWRLRGAMGTLLQKPEGL